MSLEKIHLRKLLQIFYAPNNKRVDILRRDIRSEIGKKAGTRSGGPDFYPPFWADVKNHISGQADLRALAEGRIESNARRKRLYTAMTDGFLGWWNEKRRWRNEPFELNPISPHSRHKFDNLGTVKVESLISLRLGAGRSRLIYPYFADVPQLSLEAARIALWVMSQALPNHNLADMRILDVIRGSSFGSVDVPFQGNEEMIFLREYQAVQAEWQRLRREYE